MRKLTKKVDILENVEIGTITATAKCAVVCLYTCMLTYATCYRATKMQANAGHASASHGAPATAKGHTEGNDGMGNAAVT